MDKILLVELLHFQKVIRNFLENKICTPDPLLSICTLISYIMDIIGRVAAVIGPLACPIRSARPISCLNLTKNRILGRTQVI